jgi:phage-related holin
MTKFSSRFGITPNQIFYILFILLIIIFFFFTLGSILLGHLSLTYDEPQHFRYGEQIYNLNSDRFDDSKMPVSVINVIPSKVAAALFSNTITDEWQLMSIGRISTILISLLLGLLCFHWAKTIYGQWAGLLCFGLFVFEPNLMAHSQLITTDIYAVATLNLTLYVFWQLLEKPNLWWGILTGLALGFAQIAKYSNILLIPILLLLTFIHYGGILISAIKQINIRSVGVALLGFTKYAVLILVLVIMVINIGFIFNRTGTPFGDYQFKTDFFQSLQQSLPTLRKIPVPVPYPYLEGLDFVMYRERTGDGYGNIYLLGQLREGTGFFGYYFIASMFKVPLPILALLVYAFWDWVRTIRKDKFLKQEMILLIPAFIYGIYFNFFNRAQIGIRFYLVIFPILLIFSTRVIRKWPNFSLRTRILFGCAALYLGLSVFSYFPNYLAYFNELVPNRTYAYHYLADSNIDWGQNRANLTEFLEQHPEYQFEPSAPVQGMIIVGVNELTGVIGNPNDFRWLRDNFRPIGNLDHSYLIYNISSTDLLKIK